jgi:hypothetical protein
MSKQPINVDFNALHRERQCIRDIVNLTRVMKRIRSEAKDRAQLNSALDLLSDNLEAIDDYLNSDWSESEGVRFLLIYGVLQALVLQQDALQAVASVCNVPYQLNQKLMEIRELRNNSSGHPTLREKGEFKNTSHSITRISLEHGRYQLVSSRADSSGYDFKEIDLFEIIKVQQESILAELTRISNALVAQDAAHKERFTAMKLAAILSHFLDTYIFSKLYESIDRTDILPQAKLHIDILIKSLADFESALVERNEMCSTWQAEIAYLKYPLNQLQLYFSEAPENRLNDQDARIFISYLQFASKSFIEEHVTQIDVDYAN